MELKPGHKKTELGIIPEDWDVPLLDSAAKRGSGHTPDKAHPEYWGGNIRWISLRDSDRLDRVYIFDTAATITPEGIANSSARLHPAGTVVLSRDAGVGKSAVMAADMAVSQHFIAWTCTPRLSNLFLYYYLQAKKAEFERIAMGSTIKTIGLPYFRQFRVLLPGRGEQDAIAEALIDADGLIESLEKLLAKKRQIKQGAMQELLTGKKRLPGFENPAGYQETEAGFIPADWRQVSLLEACSKIQDGTHFSPRAGGRDFLYVTSKNIRCGFLDLSTAESIDAAQHQAIYKRCDVRKGDLLLTKDGANTGNAALNSLDEQFSLLSSVAFLRFDAGIFNADFFVHQILSFHGQRQIQEAMSGNAITRLTLEKIRKLTFPVPPTKSEQDAIATVLSTMDAEATLTESKLTKARQLKQGMMQELLTGRIRLVQPSAEVVPFPVKQSASVGTNANHNPQINEAVVLAVLAHRFGSEQFPLGRFRRTKLSYLLHRHAERQVTGFLKKAAGPYSPQTRYGGAEKIALKNGYVRIHKAAKSEGFIAADNIDQAEGYFESWYGLQVLDWLKQFRYKRNEELELLTTVDMAIEDLRRDGKSVTVSAVRRIIHDSPEWKAKLDRATFADSNITAAIESCRQLFPVEE